MPLPGPLHCKPLVNRYQTLLLQLVVLDSDLMRAMNAARCVYRATRARQSQTCY